MKYILIGLGKFSLIFLLCIPLTVSLVFRTLYKEGGGGNGKLTKFECFIYNFYFNENNEV